MKKTICFLNNKGGIGKTASAVTVAHMAATVFGKRTLLVDMDPQANTSSVFSDTDYIQILRGIMSGAVFAKGRNVETMLMDETADPHDCIRGTEYAGLDIIPCCQTLAEVEERLKADVRMPQQFRLRAQLDKIKSEYDLIVIDCSPSINLLNINALAASDEVYIPTKCDGHSFIGVAISINLIQAVKAYNPALTVGGCFFTQYQKRKNVSKVGIDLLGDILSGTDAEILPITISSSTLIEQASFLQKPLMEVDTSKNLANVTKDYLLLAEYILCLNKDDFLCKMSLKE